MKPAVALAVLLSAYGIVTSSSATVIEVPSGQPTIQAGIEAASDGDTVLIAPGAYAENIDFSGKAIALIGRAGAEQTVLSPADRFTCTIRIANRNSGSALIKGFTVSGGKYSHTVILYRASATVEENIFRDNLSSYAPNIEVISCSYTSSIIRHNLFYGNGGIACIGLRNGTSGTQIINNTLDRNNRGIYSIALGGTAVNNIITNSAEYGVAISDPLYKFDLLDYNDIWNNNPNYAYYAVTGLNDISADPWYADPGSTDFHLQESSPCIDAGNPNPAFDDPDGTRGDLGAYYYHHEPSCCHGVRGNADSDEGDTVDLADLHFLIDYMFRGGPEPFCPEEADANGDGEINARDLSYIARCLFSQGFACQLADCP